MIVLLTFVAMTALSTQASADRHCSIGLGIISIALDDLKTATHHINVNELLGEIRADFEACGCAPAIDLINTLSDHNLNTPGQLLEKLGHVFTTAKQYCEY
jgi:hypothetical protein